MGQHTKFFSLLLVLVMVLTMLPIAARAEETIPAAVLETVAETIPEKIFDTAPKITPDAIPETAPETGIVSETIPFRVNPLYEGIVTVDDLDIPEFPEIDPEQIQTHANTYLSVEKAGAKVRQYLKDRKESFTVYVKCSTSDPQSAGDSVLAAAFAHTGKATEGDYLMWQFGGWGGSYSRNYNSSSKQYEFTLNFVCAYYTTAAQEKQVTTAVNSLIKSLGVKNKSDYEKVCAVYDWICDNVTYDYENLEDESYVLKHTAYAAIIDKTAVCQGYALLFYRLMLELGVDNRLIAGLTVAAEPHGWNIVKLGNYYYNVDSTWDSELEEYSFFLTNSWNFPGHYRFLDYETWEFHEEYPMAAENYDPNVAAEIDPYIYLGMCGDEAYWLLWRDGSMDIFGYGSTMDANRNNSNMQPEWVYWEDRITTVRINEGITTIGNQLFKKVTSLEEVILSSTVTSIGQDAFANCQNLKKINFPDGLLTINNSAFEGCSALTAAVFPSSLTTIQFKAFYNCDSLTEITLSSNITTLASSAFAGCDSLRTLNLDIPTIPSDVFKDCKGLTNIVFSKKVQTIKDGAFENCDGLKVLNIPGTVKSVCGFRNCDGLTTVTFNEGTTEIADDAFLNCSALTGITIPSTVTKLGTACFKNCDSILEVTIPKNVASLSSSFADCDGLTTVYVHCDRVSGSAFAGCDALSKIVLGDGVKTIDRNAFDNCDSLTDVKIAGTVESLSGFSNCDNLANVTLCEGLKAIGEYAFQNCPALTRIEFPKTTETIHSYAFDNCDGLTEITVTEGITSLSGFSNCDNLTTVNFSESLLELGAYAFQNCGALTNVKLPDSLLYIQKGAFSNCDQITTLELPENLIKLSGFAGCDNLAQIEIPDSVQEIGEYAFTKCVALTQVEIPKNLQIIGEYAFESCTGLTEVNFPKSLKTIGKKAYAYCAGLTEISFPDGLESIGEDAFQNCVGFTEVTIPASVTYLSGFRGCSNLHTATIYSSGTLGTYAFSECNKLHNLYILGEITKMGAEVFRYCDSLCQITLPATLATKGDFMDCSSLQTAVIHGDSRLESYIFSNCSSLRNVVINDDVSYIGMAAFTRTNIKHLTFKGNVGQIQSMPNFETVTFLGNAPSIYDLAFKDISTTMYYPADNSTWDSVVGKTYGGKVTWVPIGTPERLELVKTPTVTSYVAGDALNLDGILLKAYYTDGLERDVHMCDLDVVSCDMNTVGQNTVTVSCQGVTATFPIYIHASGTTVKLDPATYPAVEKGSLSDYEENVQTISYPGASSLILMFNNASHADSLSNSMLIYNQNDEVVLLYHYTEVSGITTVVPGDTAEIYLKAGYYPIKCNYSFDAIYAVTPIHTGTGGTVTPPTCIEEGRITDLVCEICGMEVGDQVLPVADHDYAAVVTVPTCQDQGYTTYTCSKCGDSYVADYTGSVDHSYENGACKWCGEAAKDYSITWVEAYSSLGGNIAVVFKAELSKDLAEAPNAFMRFTYAGKTVEIPVSEATKSGKYHNFYCRIASINMTDDITAQMMVGEEAIGRSVTTSLEKYCSYILSTSKDAKTLNLMKAMLNYGAAAQKMMKYKLDNLANKGLSEADKALTAVDASGFKHNLTGSEAGIKAAEAMLVLGSETTIRIGFTLTGNKTIDEYTFTVDGVEVKPVYKGGMYRLEVPNIAAHKLDEYHTFTCGDITITYCGLSYVNQIMKSYTEGTTFDMAVALYNYSQATEAFIS